MPTFARQVDAIPVVNTTAERAALFPNPEQNQRVQNLETGAIERWASGSWQSDYDLYSSNGAINVKTYGAVGDGATDDADAIQAAIDAAGSGMVVVPADAYYINGTITIDRPFDARGATFSVGATGSIVIGTEADGEVVRSIQVFLPLVTSSRARASVWSEGTQSGVTISNLLESEIVVPHVEGFYNGLRVVGIGTGAVHNNIHLGRLYNNKRNLLLENGSGWSNQNQYIGGHLSFDSGIGSAVADTRHILLNDLAPSTYGCPNGNTFLGTSLEGNVPEYEVECYGADNQFLNCRWEGTSPKCQFNGLEGTRNLILGGYDSTALVVTHVNSASRNALWTPTRSVKTISSTGDQERIQNLTDSNPVTQVFPSSVDLGVTGALTTWTMQWGADRWEFKATGDAHARMRAVPATGRWHFGPGDSSITARPYFAYDLFGTAAEYVQLATGALSFNSAAGAPACGTATLVGGTVTVSTTQVHTNSIVLLSRKTSGGTPGTLTYTISSETSFTITSSSGTDTSTVDWLIVGKT